MWVLKGDGSIPEGDRRILKGIGRWLQVSGEAVYGSRPWQIYGEGSTGEPEGQFTDAQEPAYTRKDNRFTAQGGSIYAFVLSYLEDGQVAIRSLAVFGGPEDGTGGVFDGKIRSVEILGSRESLVWRRDLSGLHVRAGRAEGELPVVIRVRCH